jgi:K+-sensing histidine kinase KdpD
VPYQILPLKSAARTWGLLVVEPANLRQLMIPEQQRLLETFTLLVASAWSAHPDRQRRAGPTDQRAGKPA